MTDWIILRCGSSQTLRLAETLAEAGYAVWTPAIMAQVKHARRQQKREDAPAPLMPTFVFAQAQHLHALLELSRSPSLLSRSWDSVQRRMVTKGHAPFRIFGNGSARPIQDRELRHLRLAERKDMPKAKARTYAKDEKVKLSEAGFEGLIGTVTDTRGKHTWVLFPGFHSSVQMPTWVLLPAIDETQPVQVNGVSSEQAQLARAA